MEGLSAADVVLVPYPYSDLSGAKLRPAIVLANVEQGDIVLCQVTSNPYSDSRAVEIAAGDFSEGALQRVSYVRPSKLFTGNISLVKGRVARLNAAAMKRIVDAVIKLLKGDG